MNILRKDLFLFFFFQVSDNSEHMKLYYTYMRSYIDNDDMIIIYWWGPFATQTPSFRVHMDIPFIQGCSCRENPITKLAGD